MSIPSVGEWVGAVVEDAAKAYLVKRRTKRGEKVFLHCAACKDFKDVLEVIDADQCEPMPKIESDIDWANMAIAEATDEVALEIYAIFLQAYSTPEEWRREVWKGLTPENRAKIQRFVAIAQGEEVAA